MGYFNVPDVRAAREGPKKMKGVCVYEVCACRDDSHQLILLAGSGKNEQCTKSSIGYCLRKAKVRRDPARVESYCLVNFVVFFSGKGHWRVGCKSAE